MHMEHIRTHARTHAHMHMHMHAWYVHICTCTCTRWEVTRETRQSGNSEGTTDLYYHSGTPRAAGVKRFRSRAEVARHLGLAGSATRAKPFAKLGGINSKGQQVGGTNSKGQGGFVLAAPARESNAAVIARSPELQRMRQMALEQQRQLREHHAAEVSQVMAQATQAAQAQATQAARAALGVQAAQGVQGAPLQLVTHGVGPHAFVATHGVHAKVVAAQQVHAQQMQQLQMQRMQMQQMQMQQLHPSRPTRPSPHPSPHPLPRSFLHLLRTTPLTSYTPGYTPYYTPHRPMRSRCHGYTPYYSITLTGVHAADGAARRAARAADRSRLQARAPTLHTYGYSP